MRASSRLVRLLPRLAAAWLIAALAAAGCASPPATQEARGKRTASPVSPAMAAADRLPEVARDPRERTLAELSSVLLTEKHLLRRQIDDALSKEAFPKYLEELDGQKQLLLQEHVALLSAYADRMDDQLRAHDLVLARKGSALLASRRKVVAKVIADILSRPLDFTQAQEIEVDPEKLTYCRTEAELRERWVGVLKLQVLERTQQMEALIEAGKKQIAPSKAHGAGKSGKEDGKSSKEDAKDDKAAVHALADIPRTPEGREAKARQDVATAYETRFTRQATIEPLEPVSEFLNAITAVYDPHTQYLAPADKENFDIAITGTLEGIGALLGEQDHYVAVQELVPGGAAWQEGQLEAGDLIMAVAQDGKEAVDVTDMPIDRVVSMIRGRKGTIVTLTVKKAEGAIESISIRRDVVKIEAAYARGAVLSPGAGQPAMGYIFLPGFYGDINNKGPGERNATDDVRALLAQFEKRKIHGAILDLRGNGGGLLSHARDISGLFIDKGPIVQARDSDGSLEVLADADPSVTFTGNLVVLVDRFSASASEIVAAALQDYGRAVIVGTSATHGKGTVQGVIELDRVAPAPGKDSLGEFKITVQQFFRVDGGSTQLKGVTPDVLLPDPTPYVDSGERSLAHAIPWTSVAAARYAQLPHTWTAASLAESSRQRVKANPMFARVEAFAQLIKSRRADTRLPLDRTTWDADRKRDKDALDAADPKLKDQKPLFSVDVVSDPSSAVAMQDKKLRTRLEAWKDDLSRDIWVGESLHILSDMAPKSAAR
ncbi:MAG TPA: carboxy terminal-processing peptidase [Kofleriaceae bacterium]|nr:carboxy terminal-processing peptidase [Kofleriaceae bacterium]